MFTSKGSTVPSFAALLASLLPKTFRCLRTQRICTTPREVCKSQGREGYLRATSQNLLNTNYNKLVEGARSLIATSKLSRNTYMSIASLANKAKRAAFAPLSTANALASKTLALHLSKNTLQLILCLYQYITDLLLVALFINLLFKLSKKTQMSLGGIVDKKSVKSFAAFFFVQPCKPEILFVTLEQDSCTIHKR